MAEHKIGKRIQKYREAAGLSQERLAEATELSSNFISYIERGIKQPSLENFIKIANAINISADLLLEDVLENSQKAQAVDYLSRIERLPPKDRQRIFAVLETMLSEC
jgi:transcriptional regulator with XRE-family HTH domain